MWNPPFNNARGSSSTLQLKPPFRFQDVTVAVMPLRADLAQLTNFCDKYLNQDSELVKFQPFLPYVYLMILDYGKMSVEAANMGWVSQCEVAFTVPLKWMVKKDGEWIFYDWAVNCPYIFVDNELSMTTGREVYGWPKVLARIDPTISEWVSDVRASSKVFEVKTQALDEVYENKEAKFEKFLTLRHHEVPSFLDVPPDLDGLFAPLSRMPNTAFNFMQNCVDISKTFGGIALEQFTGTAKFPNLLDPEIIKKGFGPNSKINWSDSAAWKDGMDEVMWSLFPRMYMNAINLKQFRDASSPWKACYQAITSSRMSYETVKSVVPLGQPNLAMGQIDGGFEVEIQRLGNQPVVDALGLQVERTKAGNGSSAAVLRPVLPFWLKVDMNYGRGWTIAWRSGSGDWREGLGLTHILKEKTLRAAKHKINKATAAGDQSAHIRETAAREKSKAQDNVAAQADNGFDSMVFEHRRSSKANSYNTARGAAIQELAGPFSLPNTTMRVLPLIADADTLNRFVKGYLDVDQHARFEAWGNFVYLIVYTFAARSSESDNVGLFSGREVNFAVPVKQYRWYEDDAYDLRSAEGRSLRDQQEFVSAGLVTPFSYVDDAIVAISSSEVHGVPTLKAELGSPASTWMDSSGPKTSQNLLSTSALVLPALGVGAGAQHQAFVNVKTESIVPPSDESSWRHIAQTWGPLLVDDLDQKYRQRGWRQEESCENPSFDRIRALALEVLAGKTGINSFTLKQFRDAWETDNACYQAVVKGHKKFERIHEIHEITEPLNVWINKYPTQPVSEILGLKPKYTIPGNNVEVFEALRPFWLRADVVEQLGQTLFERVAEQRWRVPEIPQQVAGWRSIETDEIQSHIHDESLQISYLEKSQGFWQRSMIDMTEIRQNFGDSTEQGQISYDEKVKSIIKTILSLETRGELRDLKIYSRTLPRKIMSDASVLGQLDRDGVENFAAFVDVHEAQHADYTSPAELGMDFGRITPATILDSIVSRQWGRPAGERGQLHTADFRINVDTLGSYYRDVLFPEFEQRDNFWPQSRDDQVATDNLRIGMAWRLWDETWTLVKAIDKGDSGRENAADSPGAFRSKALELLPRWFADDNIQNPVRWGVEHFSQLITGFRELIDWSRDNIDDQSTVRKLEGWSHFVNDMYSQFSVSLVPDPSGKPASEDKERVEPNVATVLKHRLDEIVRG